MTPPDGLVVGIDASRNRSGGAKAHLIGMLGGADPRQHGIREVHVWAYRALLEALPNRDWLVRHNPAALEQSLFQQIGWQVRRFPGEARAAECDIILNTDAGTLSSIRPCVTMSRDMLSYEPGEMARYGFSKARLRLLLLRFIQNRSLRRAQGAVFLTHYASRVIQQSCGELDRVALIPHGVGEVFREVSHDQPWPQGDRPVRALYISNATWYKHPWMVVRAVEQLRSQGHDLTLTLVGGGSGPAQDRLKAQVAQSDPQGRFVTQLEFVPQSDLPTYLAQADLFVFASSCENMPNTLVEAMAAGLPIACSNRGPMPEVLQDGGEYFDPEDPASIAVALQKLISDADLRARRAARARQLAAQYSWNRCARETWDFLVDTYAHLSR